MPLNVVEAVPASSKPPAGGDLRISTGEGHGFGASAPSSTRVSCLHIERAGGSAILLKLVELVGPSMARAKEVSPCFSSSAAAPSVRLRVFVSISLLFCLPSWREVAAELGAAGLLNAGLSLSSPS